MKEDHDCNNETCKLLNPSITELLKYQDLENRIAKVERTFHGFLKQLPELKRKDFPVDFFCWCNYHKVWQLVNLEFIRELSKVINEIDPKVIVEVGAGRGLIGRNITKVSNREVVLTDDFSWWQHIKIEHNDVNKMNYKRAIWKYKPDLIIVSWLPYKSNWTKDFRAYHSIKGYIVIGEFEGGCTGSDKDWENNWIKHDLDEVAKFGICRSDHGYYMEKYAVMHTKVTYFERPNNL